MATNLKAKDAFYAVVGVGDAALERARDLAGDVRTFADKNRTPRTFAKASGADHEAAAQRDQGVQPAGQAGAEPRIPHPQVGAGQACRRADPDGHSPGPVRSQERAQGRGLDGGGHRVGRAKGRLTRTDKQVTCSGAPPPPRGRAHVRPASGRVCAWVA
jgi:hypothetical protein